MPNLRRTGFTLLELSVVLFVLSIMAGGVLAQLAQETRLRKQRELRSRIEAIGEALLRMGIANRRLPCPADGTVAINSAVFGRETTPSGACSSGSAAGTFNDAEHTAAGAVPVRSLDLPDEYQFDPWGGRFTYVVDKRITGPGALELYYPNGRAVDPVATGAERVGSIVVKEHFVVDGAETVTVRTEHAVAAVISHGENGHGAFQISGVRKATGSHNSAEQQNCHCDATSTVLPFDAVIVAQASPLDPTKAVPNTFDDTVRYFSRGDFLSAVDRRTETR